MNENKIVQASDTAIEFVDQWLKEREKELEIKSKKKKKRTKKNSDK